MLEANGSAVTAMAKDITILVLGGYGDTGRVFCRYLLQETPAKIIVAGRRLEQAEALVEQLQQAFPPERLAARHTDAADVESLRQSFQDIDLVLVAATTTQWAKQIAEAALEAAIDYLDIYFQQNVYSVLAELQPQIQAAGRCFITQAGFHPGLPAAYMRQGAQYFDQYDQAIIAFAMQTQIEDFQSVLEIVDMVADYQPEFWQNGQWKIGTYQDAVAVNYGHRFGVRSSLPLSMVEIKSLPEQLGLQEAGVFTTGFNWFIDYLVFPLITLSNAVKRGLFRQGWAKLFVFGLNTFSSQPEGVVFLLKAAGKKAGKHHTVEIVSDHDDVYEFTVVPVIACLHQYLNDGIRQPGLWMMGHLVDPDKLIADMQAMGIKTQTFINDAS